jgi:hypothetical protein
MAALYSFLRRRRTPHSVDSFSPLALRRKAQAFSSPELFFIRASFYDGEEIRDDDHTRQQVPLPQLP